MKKRKERIEEIPYLRGLAFLAVVIQHTVAYYALQPSIDLHNVIALSILLLFVKFAVPAFVMITGLVLFYNYYEELDYRNFLVKRFKEIIVPYLIWTAFYTFFPTQSLSMLKTLLVGWISGTGSYHLWFVVMIFQFYLFFPLFRWLFKKIRPFASGRGKLVTTFAALGLVYLFFMWISSSVIPEYAGRLAIPVFEPLFVSYRDRNFLFWWYYFILGGAAGLSIVKWRGFLQTVGRWNFLLYLGLLIMCGSILLSNLQLSPVVKVNFNLIATLKPIIAVFSVSSLLAMYSLAIFLSRKHNWLGKLWIILGKYSYGAYLAHAFVLNLVIRLVMKAAPGVNDSLKTVATAVLCAIGSVGLAYLLSRIPGGRWVVGIGRRPKSWHKIW